MGFVFGSESVNHLPTAGGLGGTFLDGMEIKNHTHQSWGGVLDYNNDLYNMRIIITPGSTLVTFTPVPINSFLRDSLAPGQCASKVDFY